VYAKTGQYLAATERMISRAPEKQMVEWLKRLVIGEGNVVRERSYTNWNTLDVSDIVAEKKRELSCATTTDEAGSASTITPTGTKKKA
jgi:hypothetical protein